MRFPIASAIVFLSYLFETGVLLAADLPPRLRADGPQVQAPTLRASSAALSALPPRLRPGTRTVSQTRSQTSSTTQQSGAVPVSGVGTLCKDRAIRGEVLRPIQGEPATCNVANPMRVRSINGIDFDPAAIMTCETAKATKSWLKDTAIPAWGRLGGGLSKIEVTTSFACQSTSNPGAHARAQAMDVSGFKLKNGLRIGVASGWRDPVAGKVLRQIHKGACKPFKNALGPSAGNATRDHLHFDTASGRGNCS